MPSIDGCQPSRLGVWLEAVVNYLGYLLLLQNLLQILLFLVKEESALSFTHEKLTFILVGDGLQSFRGCLFEVT